MDRKLIGYVGAAFCASLVSAGGGIAALVSQTPVNWFLVHLTIIIGVVGALGSMFTALMAYNDQGPSAPPGNAGFVPLRFLIGLALSGIFCAMILTGCSTTDGHTVIGPWSALQEHNREADVARNRAWLTVKGYDSQVGGPSAAVDLLALGDTNASLVAGYVGDVATYGALAWAFYNSIKGRNIITGQSSQGGAPSLPPFSIQGNNNVINFTGVRP